jgi:hypothetical protein
MALAVSAAALPLMEYDDEMLRYGISGGAIVLGLAAVWLSFGGRQSTLEWGVTAFFLAAAAVLISLGVADSESKSKAAADALAQATAKETKVRHEREKADAAKKSAAEFLKKANKAPARAAALLKKAEEAEARAEEAPRRAAQMLIRVKAEQVKLDKRRKQLDEDTAALMQERAKLEAAKDKLDEQRGEVEAAKNAAANLAKNAAEEKRRAKELKEKADEKEKEAQELLKKVKDAINGQKAKLKGKKPRGRKAAITVLARIGEPAASADYDLCQIVAFDPVSELRRHALDALEQVQPKLHPLVVTLTLPPERNQIIGYLRALKELPAFGGAGIPLITAQLQGKNLHVAKLAIEFPTAGTTVLMALADTLSKVAREDNKALDLLLTLPDSALAALVRPRGRIDDIPLFYGQLRNTIGKHLLTLGKDEPAKRKAIVPFFITLLRSNQSRAEFKSLLDNRVFAANALAELAPESKGALPTLKQMKLHPSDQVRKAVAEAIAAIEKKAP